MLRNRCLDASKRKEPHAMVKWEAVSLGRHGLHPARTQRLRSPPPRENIPSIHIFRRTVNKKLCGNVSGAIRLQSSGDALTEMNSETIRLLKEKHPPAEDNLDFPNEPEVVDVPEITPTEVK